MKIRHGSLILALFFIQYASAQNYMDIHAPDSLKYYHNLKTYDPVKIDASDLVQKKKAKNLILFIGDGMGVSHVFSGLTANHGQLNIEYLKTIGFSKTQSSSNYVTDSGAGGTAIACGVKTYNGAIGVDVDTVKIKSILEYAEDNGLATGLVATSTITHATPASFIAHRKSRNMYEAIAEDFLKTDVDVFIGGGRKHFAHRKDGRNLIPELEKKGYQVFNSMDEAAFVNSGKLAVFTSEEANARVPERGDVLVKATQKAIEILSQNKKGFFLMVEGSQIDWGGHQNNTEYVVQELLDMDQCIGEALQFAAEDGNTLIVCTADHETGGMAIEKGSFQTGEVLADYTTGSHSAVMVPVFSAGPGCNLFSGIYENTALFSKMMKALRMNPSINE